MNRKHCATSVLFGICLLAWAVSPLMADPTPPPAAGGPEPTWTPFVYPATAAQVIDATERHRRLISNFRRTYRLDKALGELRTYLERRPEDPWAFLERSQCYLLMEDFAGGERDARRAMELGADAVQGTLRLAEIFARQGKHQHARDHYEKALQMAPERPEVHSLAGTFYAETGDFVEAVYQFRLALRLRPNDPQYLFAFAQAQEAAGDLQAALSAYRRQIEIQCATPERYLRLGQLYLDKGQYESAVENYEKLAAVKRKDFHVLMVLGKAYSGAGEYRKSLDAFLRAYRLKPHNAQSLLAMGQISRRMNDNDRALQVYAKVLIFDPKNPEAHFGRAQIFAEQGRLDLARGEALQAARVLASNGKIRAILAAIYRAEGKDAQADEQLALARQYAKDGEALYEEFLKRLPTAAPEPTEVESRE